MGNYDMSSGFLKGFERGQDAAEKGMAIAAKKKLADWDSSRAAQYAAEQAADVEGVRLANNLQDEFNMGDYDEGLKKDFSNQVRRWMQMGLSVDRIRADSRELLSQYTTVNDQIMKAAEEERVLKLNVDGPTIPSVETPAVTEIPSVEAQTDDLLDLEKTSTKVVEGGILTDEQAKTVGAMGGETATAEDALLLNAETNADDPLILNAEKETTPTRAEVNSDGLFDDATDLTVNGEKVYEDTFMGRLKLRINAATDQMALDQIKGVSSMAEWKKIQSRSGYIPPDLDGMKVTDIPLDSRIVRSVLGTDKNTKNPHSVASLISAKVAQFEATAGRTATIDEVAAMHQEVKLMTSISTSVPKTPEQALFAQHQADYPTLTPGSIASVQTAYKGNPGMQNVMLNLMSSDYYKNRSEAEQLQMFKDTQQFRDDPGTIKDIVELDQRRIEAERIVGMETSNSNATRNAAQDFLNKYDTYKDTLILADTSREAVEIVIQPNPGDPSVKITQGFQLSGGWHDAATGEPLTDENGNQIQSDSASLISVRNTEQSTQVGKLAERTQESFKDLASHMAAATSANDQGFELIRMAAATPSVLTAVARGNTFISMFETEVETIKDFMAKNANGFDAKQWDALERTMLDKSRSTLASQDVSDKYKEFVSAKIRFIFVQGKALGQSGNGFSNKDFDVISRSVSSTNTFEGFSKNMRNILKSNMDVYNTLRQSTLDSNTAYKSYLKYVKPEEDVFGNYKMDFYEYTANNGRKRLTDFVKFVPPETGGEATRVTKSWLTSAYGLATQKIKPNLYAQLEQELAEGGGIVMLWRKPATDQANTLIPFKVEVLK